MKNRARPSWTVEPAVVDRQDEQQDEDDDREHGQGAELPVQVGRRALLHRLRDLLHLRGALVGGEHLAHQRVRRRRARAMAIDADHDDGALLAGTDARFGSAPRSARPCNSPMLSSARPARRDADDAGSGAGERLRRRRPGADPRSVAVSGARRVRRPRQRSSAGCAGSSTDRQDRAVGRRAVRPAAWRRRRRPSGGWRRRRPDR